MLASKLLFILDDLLWVLTDSQLKAVIHYAKSLSEAMEKSAQQRKSMAATSLQVPSFRLPLICVRNITESAAHTYIVLQFKSIYSLKHFVYIL